MVQLEVQYPGSTRVLKGIATKGDRGRLDDVESHINSTNKTKI